MNIVYSSSDSYSMICGISLISLLINNNSVKEINVFIIDNMISDLNKKKLYSIASKYKRNLFFISSINLEKMAGTKIKTAQWNISTFFRLFLGIILPSNIERIIYLDCDTIVLQNLSELYNLELGDCIVAGADDCRSDNYRKEIGLQSGDTYINNGVLLMNLKKWRNLNLDQECLSFISNHHGDITYMDQGVLNGILGKRHMIKEIPPKYNSQRIFFDFSFPEIIKLRKPEHHCTKEEYVEAVTNPTIVHFTPTFITGTRPWNINDKHKYTPQFIKYKEISPWKDVPLTKSSRKFGLRVATNICNLLPRRLMISEVSLLHSKIYPWFRKCKDLIKR